MHQPVARLGSNYHTKLAHTRYQVWVLKFFFVSSCSFRCVCVFFFFNAINNSPQWRGRFGDVTQTAYGFWLYDLCDTYLELIKPIVGDKSEGNKKVWRRFSFPPSQKVKFEQTGKKKKTFQLNDNRKKNVENSSLANGALGWCFLCRFHFFSNRLFFFACRFVYSCLNLVVYMHAGRPGGLMVTTLECRYYGGP